jgi:hypothetical protein
LLFENEKSGQCPLFLVSREADYFLTAAFLAGAAAGLATTTFLTGSAVLAAAALGAAAFLAGLFAGLAAGMSDSSINEGFGRKAFCLKYFHAFKRRGRIVNKRKRAPQGLAHVFKRFNAIFSAKESS